MMDLNSCGSAEANAGNSSLGKQSNLSTLFSPTIKHSRRANLKRGKTGCITCRMRGKKCPESFDSHFGNCSDCVKFFLECIREPSVNKKRPDWLNEDTLGKVRNAIKEHLQMGGFMRGANKRRGTPVSHTILRLRGKFGIPLAPASHNSICAVIHALLSDENEEGVGAMSRIKSIILPDQNQYEDFITTYPGETQIVSYFMQNNFLFSIEDAYNSASFQAPNLSMDLSPFIQFEDGIESADIGIYFQFNIADKTYYLSDTSGLAPIIRRAAATSLTAQHAISFIAKTFVRIENHDDVVIDADFLKTMENFVLKLQAKMMHDNQMRGQIEVGDAIAALQAVSIWLFTGAVDYRWLAALNAASHFTLRLLHECHAKTRNYQHTLCSVSDDLRYIIKTMIWFDVLASITLRRRPIFAEIIEHLYPFDEFIRDRERGPKLAMINVMGCESHTVRAISDILCLDDRRRQTLANETFDVNQFVKEANRLNCYFSVAFGPVNPPTLNSAEMQDPAAVLACAQWHSAIIFHTSACLLLQNVMHGDQPGNMSIQNSVENTISALRMVPQNAQVRRAVVRSLVFGICICGSLTKNEEYRRYLIELLDEQIENQKAGNSLEVRKVLKSVWETNESWWSVVKKTGILLV